MPAINNLSDEPKYIIKQVSDLTGVLPVTLRAWERRYGVLTPERRANRYRLYSDQDVAIIKWLNSRLASGISISTAASNLRNIRINNQWPEIVPVGIIQKKASVSIPPERYAEELFNLLTHHNEAGAAMLMQEIITNFDLETMLMGIITPCLIAIGDGWYKGNITISTEHFASAVIRSRLYNLFQSYPIVSRGDNILIGCAPTEEHELGALMMALLLRSKGGRVEYLGPNLHLDDLIDYSKSVKPSMVILTASTRTAALEMARAQSKFNTQKNPPIFCYAGLAFVLEPALITEIHGIYLGDSIARAVGIIKQLIENKSTGNKKYHNKNSY